MIIYNIRQNGPYELDKFILNIGQLHNLVYNQRQNFNSHKKNKLYEQLEKINSCLSSIYDEQDSDIGSNQIYLMLQKARIE